MEIEELLAGRVALALVLMFELVIMLEELLSAKTVLEVDLKLEPELKVELEVEPVGTIDESVKDTETLELDVLLRLELVEIVEELEIGYRTLLEPDLLLDIEIGIELAGPEPDTLLLVMTVLDDEGELDLVGRSI